MAKDPELPIRIIRERGKTARATYKQNAEVRRTIDRPSHEGTTKRIITHRVNEQGRGQQEHLGRRIAFRKVVTEESLRRRRIAASEAAGERRSFQNEQSARKYGADVLQGTGARSTSVSIASVILRIFVAIFLLAMLFLIVSRGQQTGDAIQKVGFFLNGLTSSQPLFKKVG